MREAQFYDWRFLGYGVILCVLQVGSEYKQNTEVMEMSKVWPALKTHQGKKKGFGWRSSDVWEPVKPP